MWLAREMLVPVRPGTSAITSCWTERLPVTVRLPSTLTPPGAVMVTAWAFGSRCTLVLPSFERSSAPLVSTPLLDLAPLPCWLSRRGWLNGPGTTKPSERLCILATAGGCDCCAAPFCHHQSMPLEPNTTRHSSPAAMGKVMVQPPPVGKHTGQSVSLEIVTSLVWSFGGLTF